MKRFLLCGQRARQRGVGIVEILVGLLIGMIGVVVIFSMLSVSEERKRSTAAGSDAQTAGAIALYTLERDIQQAGFGFAGAPVFFGCEVAIHNSARTPQNFTLPLAPVRIIQGAGGAPDSIVVWYGNSHISPITKQFDTVASGSGSESESEDESEPAAVSDPESKIIKEGVGGLLKGDLVLLAGTVSGASSCPNADEAVALVQVSDVSDPTGLVMEHSGGQFNREGGPNVPNPFTRGFVFNLGPQPVINQWSITERGTLQVQDLLRLSQPVEVGENIVNLQAQYGIYTTPAGSPPVLVWQDAQPTAAQWPHVRAIRIAILTRSANWEREQVTTAAPAWYDDATKTDVPFVMSNLPDGTDWRHYRYRVYQTVIPLPNIVLGTNT